MIRIVWICRLMLFVACLGVFDARSAETNFLAFHLLAEGVSIDGLGDGTALPENLKLDPQPILSDADFRAYTTNDPVFGFPALTVTADAAKRLYRTLWERESGPASQVAKRMPKYHLCGPDTAFVLMAMHSPIYVGVFIEPNTSHRYLVPTVCPMPEFGAISTNFTNNVTFAIRMAGVSSNYAAISKTPVPIDRRNDSRILEAIKKLGLSSK